MTINETIKKIGIKKFLIVDDKEYNTTSAVNYLKKYGGLEINTASNAEEAKKMIKTAFGDSNKYDLVVSDLIMEKEKSGLEVMEEAYRHFTYGMIVTGYAGGHHGFSTTIYPGREVIRGKKPAVWAQTFEKIFNHLNDSKNIYRSFEQIYGVISTPFESGARSARINFLELR
jgi:hypothetical protein